MTWLSSLLERQRRRAPAELALCDARRALTWAQLGDEVAALATHLAAQTRRGDRVVLASTNCVEVIEAYCACAQAGVVACPLNPTYTDRELDYILGRLEPSAALVDERSAARFPAALPRVLASDVAGLPCGEPGRLQPLEIDEPSIIFQTSATTGLPKGVVVDQRSLQTNALGWLGDLRPPAGTRFLQVGPLFHGSAVIAFDYLAAGCPLYVLDRFTPQGCAAALSKWRIQETFLVPSMLHLLLESRAFEQADLAALVRICHGAAPMPAPLAQRAVEALGVELHNIYGITEGGGPALGLSSRQAPAEPAVLGATCAGLPLPGVAVRILAEGERPAASAEVGSIQLKGDGLMHGYWRDEDATSRALVDGWLVTGDLGYRDAQGHLWLVDRRTDLVLRGGQNVYPAEIERVLGADPMVADVAVVAVPDAVWGQTPYAFIQIEAGASFDLKRLIRRCVDDLAPYKRPSGFEVIDRIPRNPAGKILRRELRDRASSARSITQLQGATL